MQAGECLESMPVLLLSLFGLALSAGAGVVSLAVRRGLGHARARQGGADRIPACGAGRACFLRPACWLAVKSRNVLAVQSALGLRNVKRCSWLEGLAGEEKLFIAPPVKGWILVMGSGLQKCGIPLPKREFSSPEEAAGARMRARLLDLHETATAWFEEQLRGPEGALAREYLAGRGLSDEGIKRFRIGYGPTATTPCVTV